MVRSKKKKARKPIRRSVVREIYLKVILICLGVIMVASFYVYQRVWVRNLIGEVELLEVQNEAATLELQQIRQDWVAAASIASVEERLNEFRLKLRPTLPDQNLALRVLVDNDRGRYSGIVKALEKIKTNFPVMAPNEAGAEELFEDK